MNILRILLNAVFVFAVIFIWLMLIYQFLLAVGGFRLRLMILKEEKRPMDESALPDVSILIPAKNEEKVIGGLLDKISSLQYPAEKLEVIVINDGSTDATGEIVEKHAGTDPRVRRLDIPLPESGRGKGAALNRGLQEAKHEVIAVYDADNLPEADSLAKLCRALADDPKLAALTGKFRAYNKNKNLLTRLINIESIAFQWIIQAGRSIFLKICFLPGTNFVIRKSVLQEVGGWDENALTEDSELTMRIYEKGLRIKFLPTSTSWEQEPERLGTWIRQRTRWARGNNYLIAKYARRLLRPPIRLTAIEILNLLYLYYFFIFAILFSDLFFILSLLNVVHVRVPGPYAELWGLAFLLFLIEIMIALSFEREDSLVSLGLATLAYLTYTKLWVFVVIKSLFEEYIFKRKKIWMKTERFDVGFHPNKDQP